jgi:hypothetical protein
MQRPIRSTAAALATLTTIALAAQDPLDARAEPAVSVAFPGGTLSAFVAEVRKADKSINIVVSALADDVEVPALALQSATVYSALRAVGQIVPQDFHVNVEVQPPGPSGTPVYAVAVRPMQQPATAAAFTPLTKVVQVFSLRQLTDRVPGDPQDVAVVPPKTILTAIDTGLGIDGGKDDATIRYHEDSGLLFVQGTPEQTNLVSEVLRSMIRDLEMRRQAAQQARLTASRAQGAPAQPEPEKEKAPPGKREKGEDA